MLILKVLHIASMFAGVSLVLGMGSVAGLVARKGDVRSIRSTFPIFNNLARFIPVFFILGVVFGLATAWVGGFDLLRPWLLIAYVLFIAASALGAGIEGPWQQKVLAAANSSPDDAPSIELMRIVHDPRERFAFWATIVILAAFLVDMVFKPFGL
jgi:uncharacterized membrane protein